MDKKSYNFGWAQCWNATIQQIFDAVRIKSMIEFGLGVGTEYLLDNVEHLTSVELAVSELNEQWTEQTKQSCGNRANWTLYYEKMPNSVINANSVIVEKGRNHLSDNSYLSDLESVVKKHINSNYDMLFVDAGIHQRGEIVLMGMQVGIPIIVAHDTNYQEIYGYNLVDSPMYNVVYSTGNSNGTVVWCKHDSPLSKAVSLKFNNA